MPIVVYLHKTLVVVVLMSLLGSQSNGLSPSSSQQKSPCRYGCEEVLPKVTITRRLAVARLFSALVATTSLKDSSPVVAFENGVPEMELYKNKTKHPGTKPLLGLGTNGKLAICDDGLNCFSTSGDEVHRLEMWKPRCYNKAMGEILDTINTYPPGQARIDKGGFSIITADADYLYVQFESMKHGFIDDVEFAVTNKGVQVRSSSRIGSQDLGVNAKRLNWISAELRAKGWTAPTIIKDDYPDYFPTLVYTYDDYIRSVLSPLDCPVPALPLTCKDPSPPKV